VSERPTVSDAERLRRRQYASPEHRNGRAAALAVATPTDPCARCFLPLGPEVLHSPDTLHYDHNEERDGYLGLSHGLCNERADRGTRPARGAPGAAGRLGEVHRLRRSAVAADVGGDP
jgi:hypothetical protein